MAWPAEVCEPAGCPPLLEAPEEADELGEGAALILSPASLQVTLTSLDIPFAMFAPKTLELEDADPLVSPSLSDVCRETAPRWSSFLVGRSLFLRGALPTPSAHGFQPVPRTSPCLRLVLKQVNPPDSPETTSPLQGSLHSDGSSGGSSGHTQDDFVMIDFVSCQRLPCPLLLQGQ